MLINANLASCKPQNGVALEFVDAPHNMKQYGYLTLRVNDNSFYPRYYNGELIAFKRVIDWKNECINKECVVRLEDGRTVVRTVSTGMQPDTYRLDSHSAPSIENAKIEWAARVLLRL